MSKRHVTGRTLIAPILAAGLLAGATCFVSAAYAGNGTLPEIRTSATNRVPACVTPDRLMAFVAARNPKLPVKFDTIAVAYRDLGEIAHVRWDYAFFQMALETNYLMYKRGDGSSGDVGQAQNNFAGIGATGGGAAGDHYPDVRTGVLAHIQHLVAYSGEKVERPVAQRTREYQGDIIEVSRKLGRPVTFSDLSHRWAVDRGYAKNIETIAELYRRANCSSATGTSISAEVKLRPTFYAPNRLGAISQTARPDTKSSAAPSPSPLVRTIWRRGDPVPPAPQPAGPRRRSSSHDTSSAEEPAAALAADAVTPSKVQPDAQPSGVGRFAMAPGSWIATASRPDKCRIYSASYGGMAAVLIRSKTAEETRLTALTVALEQRDAMAANYLEAYAQGGEIIGHYDDKASAVAAARGLCPTG